MTKSTKMRKLLGALVVIWAVIGLYLALLPDSPGGFFGSTYRHVLVAAILAFGCAVTRRSVLRPRNAAAVLVGSILLGAAVEWAQSWQVIGRNVERSDIAENTIGVAVGLVVAALLWKSAPTRARPVATLAVAGAIVVASVGSVRTSAPIMKWLTCRSERTDPSEVQRTLTERVSGASIERNGNLQTTEFGPGRTTERNVRDLIKELSCRNRFTVSFVATPTNTLQRGPRRIVALSGGTEPEKQNFVAGIDAENLILRIRLRQGSFQPFVVGAVFRENTEARVDVIYQDGLLRVRVDGAERLAVRPYRPDLRNWLDDVPLSIGNEISEDRRFEGTIRDVVISAAKTPAR